MKITTIGIGLAANGFQVYGVDECGRAVLDRRIKPARMTAFFARLPPCRIALPGRDSAFCWARVLQSLGHDVWLIPPRWVVPDAQELCLAVGRPDTPMWRP